MSQSCKPLSLSFPAQCQAQPAYLEISENGDISCDWSGEIGNGQPLRVWHNIDMRFGIDNALDQEDIDELIERVRPLALILLKTSAIEWDGNNFKRKFTNIDVLEQIEMVCSEAEPAEWQHCGDESCDRCNYEG